MNLQQFDDFENNLIKKFGEHEVLSGLSEFSNSEFLDLLLQRRFLSLSFTPLYEACMAGISGNDAILVCREIVKEEYPENLPSHREELVKDLMLLGLSRKQIVNSERTQQTTEALERIFAIARYEENSSNEYDAKASCMLRFWGEVLVSEEYAKFVEKMKKMGLDKKNSRFYWPHFLHDAKRAGLHQRADSVTHSDAMTTVLQKLLKEDNLIDYCAKVEEEVLDAKMLFYDQFK